LSSPPDSIDLQDHDTPSAKEHKHPASNPVNGHAPHQAETLREIAAETKQDRRVSWNEDMGDLQIADDGQAPQQDALGIAQNGEIRVAVEGDLDIDDDADLDEDEDDDMMDKISSSPSIEDGEDAHAPELPHTWPARVDSLRNPVSPSASPASSDRGSSSPYLERPTYLPAPLRIQSRQSSKASSALTTISEHSCAPPPRHYHHHLRGQSAGEYAGSGQGDDYSDDVFYEREPIDDV
jgi:hypothetical protein